MTHTRPGVMVGSITRMPNTRAGNPVWSFRDQYGFTIARTSPDSQVGHKVSALLNYLPVEVNLTVDEKGDVIDYTEPIDESEGRPLVTVYLPEDPNDDGTHYRLWHHKLQRWVTIDERGDPYATLSELIDDAFEPPPIDVRDWKGNGYDPLAALTECYDLWASGAWHNTNAEGDLDETMEHVGRLLAGIEERYDASVIVDAMPEGYRWANESETERWTELAERMVQVRVSPDDPDDTDLAIRMEKP